MAERKHITLIYQYSENWIGGTYYILNIIKALNFLEDSLKPHLTIAYQKASPIEIIEKIGYPYITYFNQDDVSLNIAKRIVNKLFVRITGEKIFKLSLPGNSLYPVNWDINTKKAQNYYFWITDFQNRHLPHFFQEHELARRLKFQDYINKFNKPVAFSSQNAKNDFDNFYPGNKCKKVVLPFVSILDENVSPIPIKSLLVKFNIVQPFFIVPNQFWKHKNHWIILKAIVILKSRGINYQVVFTGKEYDHRNPLYADSLKTFVKDNGLEKQVLFLGFIDRNEQLQLMKNSLSIIQPSFFEGWSTVVEDAKALNHYIIVSDIPLHKEQINQNCIFFNPEKADDLAIIMEDLIINKPITIDIDYKKNIYQFGLKLLSNL